MLQDTHLHIQDIKNPTEISTFISDAFAAGFGRFFNCAITPSDWPIVKSLADHDPRVIPFYGFHPWFGDLAEERSFAELAEYLAAPNALAGEMGLDRARKNIDFGLQKQVFTRQLDLARHFQKPFAVHCVRAWSETIELIKTTAPGIKFLMHSFNGSREIAQEISEMGGFFSVPVRQFLKSDAPFKDVFAALPLDRVLIETDFPYQVKWTATQDYASAVRQGYMTAAAWRGLSVEEFTAKVYDNGTFFAY